MSSRRSSMVVRSQSWGEMSWSLQRGQSRRSTRESSPGPRLVEMIMTSAAERRRSREGLPFGNMSVLCKGLLRPIGQHVMPCEGYTGEPRRHRVRDLFPAMS